MKNKVITLSIAVTMALIIFVAQVLVGCKASNTTKGGAIGAGVGGAIGGVIGHQSDNTVNGGHGRRV